MGAVLRGESVPLRTALLWNAGFYLWRLGAVSSVEAGIHHTALLLDKKIVADYWDQIVSSTAKFRNDSPTGASGE